MIKLDNEFYFIFVGLPILLPFLIGSAILVLFWKDKLNRLIGFFTLKPVLAYPLWFFISDTVVGTLHDNWFDNITKSFGNLLPLVPAIILSLGIIYLFRGMFTNRLAQLFLGLDILRMLNTFMMVSTNAIYFFMTFGLLLPSLIAFLALGIAWKRKSLINSVGLAPKA